MCLTVQTQSWAFHMSVWGPPGNPRFSRDTTAGTTANHLAKQQKLNKLKTSIWTNCNSAVYSWKMQRNPRSTAPTPDGDLWGEGGRMSLGVQKAPPNFYLLVQLSLWIPKPSPCSRPVQKSSGLPSPLNVLQPLCPTQALGGQVANCYFCLAEIDPSTRKSYKIPGV